MYKLNSALILCFIGIALYVLSLYIESPNLELFSRPVIIPSIFYFYLSSIKGKINIWYAISILLYLIGEILYMISQSEFFILGLFFFLAPYFLVLYFLGKDFIYYLKLKKYVINSIALYVIVLLLFSLLYNVMSFNDDSFGIEYNLYIGYAIALFIMSILTFIIQYNFSSRAIMFMVLMVVCFLVSDVFFVFANKIKGFVIFEIISVIAQQFSYLFFTLYFMNRTK